MTNIHDIARLSGYSVSTVSRVINHHKYVTDSKRAEIEAIMRKLDYTPNNVARDLSRGSTHTIGVVVPYANHPYFTQIVNGIMMAAFEAHYKITLLPTNYDANVEREYLGELKSKTFDALIFTSRSSSLEKLVSYQKYGRIVCCEDPGNYRLSAAYTDREQSYVTALEFLKAKQYQRVGVVLSRNSQISASSRMTRRAYEKVYGSLADDLLFTGAVTYDDGYLAGEYFSSVHPKVDAILANGDDIAAGVTQYYRQHHLPKVTIIGQENLLSSQLLKLSTVDHHLKSLGEAAFKLSIFPQVEQRLIKADFVQR